MSKRKPMSAIPDFSKIDQAAGKSRESIDKLEAKKIETENWSKSNVSESDNVNTATQGNSSKQKSRIGRVPIQGYFSENTRDRLKFLALRDKTTVENLMNEAFEVFFEQNKHNFKGISHLE